MESENAEESKREEFKISAQALKALNLKKDKGGSGKTMFKMPKGAFEFISQFSDVLNESTRGTLDILTKSAEKNFDKCTRQEIPADAIRKSIGISDEAKIILARLAKKFGLSRDEVLYSLIVNWMEAVNQRNLSNEEKIKHARALEKMANDMLKIYDSPEATEARKKLFTCGDPDLDDTYGAVETLPALIPYIEQLYEFQDAIENFIDRKEKERNG